MTQSAVALQQQHGGDGGAVRAPRRTVAAATTSSLSSASASHQQQHAAPTTAFRAHVRATLRRKMPPASPATAGAHAASSARRPQQQQQQKQQQHARSRSSSTRSSVDAGDDGALAQSPPLADDYDEARQAHSQPDVSRASTPSVDSASTSQTVDDGVPHNLPLLSKSYEESFLREPIFSQDERPCVCDDRCEGRFISGSPGFTLTEFLLPDEMHMFRACGRLPYQRKMCLLCLRKDVQRNLIALKAQQKATLLQGNGFPSFAIQSYGNHIDVPGEYKHGICHPVQPEYGIVAPVVRHKRKLLRYWCDPNTGIKWYKQIRVEFEDPSARGSAADYDEYAMSAHDEHEHDDGSMTVSMYSAGSVQQHAYHQQQQQQQQQFSAPMSTMPMSMPLPQSSIVSSSSVSSAGASAHHMSASAHWASHDWSAGQQQQQQQQQQRRFAVPAPGGSLMQQHQQQQRQFASIQMYQQQQQQQQQHAAYHMHPHGHIYGNAGVEYAVFS